MPEDGKPWWERRSDNWISGASTAKIEATYQHRLRVAQGEYTKAVRAADQERNRAIAKLEGKT